MATNLLVAIRNLVNKRVSHVSQSFSSSSNRINQQGNALEFYIKDLFCDSFDFDLESKNQTYRKFFSYLGSQNNPPDFMIRGGDAIEVKKITTMTGDIALNSSYPKAKLNANSRMITDECRSAEDWDIKDHLYCIGSVQDDDLKSIWFVYGDCYAASSRRYERIRNVVSEGINQLEDVEFSPTNELARVNQVDSLGITSLRVRAMWTIKNPFKVFNYISDVSSNHDFSFHTIMKQEKYMSFSDNDRFLLESIKNSNFSITTEKIKIPDNPERLESVKLIKYWE